MFLSFFFGLSVSDKSPIPWIMDSSAIDHMINSLIAFNTYLLCLGNREMATAYGSLTTNCQVSWMWK